MCDDRAHKHKSVKFLCTELFFFFLNNLFVYPLHFTLLIVLSPIWFSHMLSRQQFAPKVDTRQVRL